MPSAPKTQSTHLHEVKNLLEWEAPGRPYQKRHKSYYTTSLLLMFFIEVILFLFSQYMLMLVVASLVFVAFALATVPPHNFHYRISSEGILVENHFFIWEDLYDFFFVKQHNQEVLIIRSRTMFPGEITITLGDIGIDKIKHALLPYLPFREYIDQTFAEKMGNWMNQTFPLEPIQTTLIKTAKKA